jgi:hypothetical protein
VDWQHLKVQENVEEVSTAECYLLLQSEQQLWWQQWLLAQHHRAK